MQYIALLRGINVGGNNKVSMTELKDCFDQAGFSSVRTYINSGNVLFEASQEPEQVLIKKCEKAIENRFGISIICTVVSAFDLQEAVQHAPEWWGLADTDKHNALFVIPPATPETVMKAVGEAKPAYEKIAAYGPVIYWTAPLKTFSQTRYSKIVSLPAYKSVTIRNANTTRKLVALSQPQD